MTAMTDIMKTLEKITTGYSIFEKDQVLTHDQLNSISEYFDDQTRLTRVKLLGVGIVCGLRVSLKDNKATVTKGVGITTDGDLLCFDADTAFDRFKLYDESHPVYSPFYIDNTMIPLYELVSEGSTEDTPDDPLAVSLAQFNLNTGKTLNNMIAVLFMESYVNDPDICSSTDCDNLGQDCINTIKLLLVEKSSVGLLKEDVVTPDTAYNKLHEMVADRAIIPTSTNALDQLVGIYLKTCNKIHGKLMAELPNLYSNCVSFLADIFPSDPTEKWTARLTEINSTFTTSGPGIQYYYDFLKDIVETYNHFRDLLFNDNTWCCPEGDAFQKHLLLGNLISGANPDENRTGFYPSNMTSKTSKQLDHAKFLAKKLNTLIQIFEVPQEEKGLIRITPSLFEDQPLEERAIPYYYPVNETTPIHKSWNYRLHQRGMDTYNYAYHAGDYKAQGGAARPLTAQIRRFSFFRIEGHLGQDISTALASIKKEVQSKNLPFIVRSVMIEMTIGYPSIEHFAGVVSGGTLVLVYDKSDLVVADFMLPYCCSEVFVTVNPPMAEVLMGGHQQLTATVIGTKNQGVTWSVENGGGQIDENGLYIAPTKGGTYHLVAASVADPSKSAMAIIKVPDIAITITPQKVILTAAQVIPDIAVTITPKTAILVTTTP